MKGPPVRKPFIAGNWKMNLNREQAVQLARGVAEKCGNACPVDVAVCPPFVYVEAVRAALQGSGVGLGAQNMYHEAEGAFTGEISGKMLLDAGCRYVILGKDKKRKRKK